jgi:hypothetical protein
VKLKQNANQRQRFVLSPEILYSISTEEIHATWKDMCELGIEKPPYHHFDIEVCAANVFRPRTIIPAGTHYENFDDLLSVAAEKSTISGKNVFNIIFKCNFSENYKEYAVGVYTDMNDGNFKKIRIIGPDRGEATVPTGIIEFELSQLQNLSVGMMQILTVLLATKNIVKEVKIDKLAKLGIGKNKHRPYTTTYLKIGKITESVDRSGKTGCATGEHVRPHLRRGHKRNQRFGLELKYTKAIFIQPVFVNADKEWISDRTEYRVIKGDHK